jgi:hypothetical protein
MWHLAVDDSSSVSAAVAELANYTLIPLDVNGVKNDRRG